MTTTPSVPKTHPRSLSGVVVSTKMNKTIVVRVDRVRMHPKYLKRFAVSNKFHVHDEQNAAKVGDVVTFEETRPLSATKRWRLLTITSTATQ